MQNAPIRALVLIACAMPLGACNSLFGIKFARSAPKAEAVLAAKTGHAEAGPVTQAGRQQLTIGQVGLAIQSFQHALAVGEPVAPAANGLGVAFARLGRFELAAGYFQRAIAADPADARYAQNLGRLTRSPTMLMRRDADLAAAVLRAEQAAQGGKTGEATTARTEPGRMQRVSRGEVRIATVAPQTAPLRSTRGQLDKRFRPIVRITFAEPPAESKPEAIPARAESSLGGQ